MKTAWIEDVLSLIPPSSSSSRCASGGSPPTPASRTAAAAWSCSPSSAPPPPSSWSACSCSTTAPRRCSPPSTRPSGCAAPRVGRRLQRVGGLGHGRRARPSYWSQIKGRSRQIGERLARQFEHLCRSRAAGWTCRTVPPPRASHRPLARAKRRRPTKPCRATTTSVSSWAWTLTYHRRHPHGAHPAARPAGRGADAAARGQPRTRGSRCTARGTRRRRAAGPGGRGSPCAVAAHPGRRGAAEAQEVARSLAAGAWLAPAVGSLFGQCSLAACSLLACHLLAVCSPLARWARCSAAACSLRTGVRPPCARSAHLGRPRRIPCLKDDCRVFRAIFSCAVITVCLSLRFCRSGFPPDPQPINPTATAPCSRPCPALNCRHAACQAPAVHSRAGNRPAPVPT